METHGKETLLHLSHELQSCPSQEHTVTLLGLLAGSRGPIPAPFAIAGLVTRVGSLERSVEFHEQAILELERQVSVADMLETRVQETQKVVAELVIMLDKSERDLRKQLDSNFTELEDDLELRVDEIAKSVLLGSKELQVLARSVKNLEHWGDEVPYRYLRPLDDRVTHLEQCWS